MEMLVDRDPALRLEIAPTFHRQLERNALVLYAPHDPSRNVFETVRRDDLDLPRAGRKRDRHRSLAQGIQRRELLPLAPVNGSETDAVIVNPLRDALVSIHQEAEARGQRLAGRRFCDG